MVRPRYLNGAGDPFVATHEEEFERLGELAALAVEFGGLDGVLLALVVDGHGEVFVVGAVFAQGLTTYDDETLMRR